ncbi:hypothetical protein HZS_2991 [Henneguya salminicola]|nr:hypothetical protein HZS_2991 [Henneguya salminicola]
MSDKKNEGLEPDIMVTHLFMYSRMMGMSVFFYYFESDPRSIPQYFLFDDSDTYLKHWRCCALFLCVKIEFHSPTL